MKKFNFLKSFYNEIGKTELKVSKNAWFLMSKEKLIKKPKIKLHKDFKYIFCSKGDNIE